MLNVPGVFLRRPLSVYSVKKGEVSFLYRVIGKGTKNLSQLKKGEVLKVFGPLGNGYDLSSARKKCVVLLAGGTGLASLNCAAEKLSVPGIVLYGAKTKNDLASTDNLKKLGWDVRIYTDNGSKGKKGYVTEGIEAAVKKHGSNCVIYACGPHLMLKTAATIAIKAGVEGYASLEEMMACGMGNCQGCAVEISGEYKMVCSDGPVFDIRQIEW
ncbi:MAG TPA: hypothetical protein DEE98_07010 [Elusimicrobia bacterium]|nr:MAG: hypothetical protein A2278_01395 [Elusimicrobia bacterium RIFOXYA12_FULL_49_49]OGS09530.1 MAG: hypothetical protein A2204_06550 [Elusimicrobia bacterium RIFOXYA1_FULL_47_7]OGS10018.1 MAG: hypothetical protein A2386_05980 [Elusimicrobia bacterium RIFOXYB1_FULL_48_9]OGS15491.1 MAG: hypothetical protein A2251_03130 [Elusimicrobia bacterium RIFOXYA2_FULL_47_53]OGS26986.1 MAG: hypothetical protein A2339_04645 [Elusimicrobia bacterium RIFOXYB12_FULL_50_12]OGS30931.1 MAG: hypothetical protein